MILAIEHSPAAYRATRTFGWFGIPQYLYPEHARAALLEVFPWEALALSVLATGVLAAAAGPQEGVGLGVCVALSLVTVQMMSTRSYLTEHRLVRRSGLLLTRRTLSLPLATVSDVRVVNDPEVDEDFGDLVVEASGRTYHFRAVANAADVAAQIRRRLTRG
jgi:hypothetical protein